MNRREIQGNFDIYKLWNDVKKLIEDFKAKGKNEFQTKAQKKTFKILETTNSGIEVRRKDSVLESELIPKKDFIDMWEDLNRQQYKKQGYKQKDLHEGQNRHTAVSFALVGMLPYVEWQKIGRVWKLVLIEQTVKRDNNSAVLGKNRFSGMDSKDKIKKNKESKNFQYLEFQGDNPGIEFELTGNDIINIKNYVKTFSDVVDLQFNDESNLPVNPRSSEGMHYLLLVASVNMGTKAENVREFVKFLYKRHGKNLYSIIDENIFKKDVDIFQNTGYYLGRNVVDKAARILSDVNIFVNSIGGNLLSWGKKFDKPEAIVEQFAYNIYYMGASPTSAQKKAWMYMRWMVRPYPDLHMWNHISLRYLYVPTDRNVLKFVNQLGIIESREANRNARDKITEFAKQIFPNDPARVDYPFFAYGRKECKKYINCDECPIKNLMRCI